ncbi:protein-tyrosine phosphatase family protein [Alteromonas gilva]|uniref:Tyrosine specific protein phosphatases domain-containing protein n=1 Tax=Alteromonas gilva TaxID=2987522 RepID=A0ABT5KZB6_9ALTE|nr:hypothetical protein [Alteromonas gilva]MDC8830112.1 hypothetical protein [Alteromonas gilva]
MSTNLTWFTLGNGRLTLGARPTPDYLEKLRDQGISHIASIQTSDENKPQLKTDVESKGLKWLWLPFNVADMFVSNDTEKAFLQQYLAEVAQTLREGGSVYLHCDGNCERCRLFLYALCIHQRIPAGSAYNVVHSFGGDKANQLSRRELQQAAAIVS